MVVPELEASALEPIVARVVKGRQCEGGEASPQPLERLTLGLQPEDLVALVQTQAAVLEASDAGVVAVDPEGVAASKVLAAPTWSSISPSLSRKV